MRWGVPAVLLLQSVVASGCALKSDVRDIREDIRRLTARQDSALAQLTELVEANQDSIGQLSESSVQLRGDLARQLLDIQDQLVTLQELSGQSQRNLAALRDQLEARRSDIALPPVVEAPGDTAGAAEELYNAAMLHFQRGTNTTARSAFEQFLQVYPNHALAPKAHYWLADILVQEGRLEEAIEGFVRIQELYPTAEEVPDALYRVGLLHRELGDMEEARRYLERVVNSYPDSRSAQLARRALEEIR
jgi:tol-pal system protein YbgF